MLKQRKSFVLWRFLSFIRLFPLDLITCVVADTCVYQLRDQLVHESKLEEYVYFSYVRTTGFATGPKCLAYDRTCSLLTSRGSETADAGYRRARFCFDDVKFWSPALACVRHGLVTLSRRPVAPWSPPRCPRPYPYAARPLAAPSRPSVADLRFWGPGAEN
jgi:hypothetical protein